MSPTDEDLDVKDPTAAANEDVMEIDLGDGEDDGTQTNPDGSVEVVVSEGTGATRDPEFYANLADGVVDDFELNELSSRLYELTELDKDSHKQRVLAYKNALERSGLDGNPTGGAEFDGASKAVLPMVQEAAIDFMSSAIRELMPIGGEEGGPVKHKVIGKATQRKVDKAYRKSQLMNWQLTQQMPSFRDSLEELLTQLPMSGRQYLKMYWNHARGRPEELFVPMDEVWLPAASSSFASARRYTHAQPIDEQTLQERMDSGMYRKIVLSAPMVPEQSEAKEATDKIAGKTKNIENEDGERLLREIFVHLEIESDAVTGGKLAPYIVTLDDDSQQILSIYRDWKREDPNREALKHLIEFPFIPWRGGPIGLPQLIGGLSVAGTGALRALLDSAHLNNLSGAVALKGKAGKGGQNIPITAGSVTQIDAPVGTDDIRKAIMALPFSPPSPTLFQLLGFLVEQGRGVVNVALEKLAEAKADMPVGTTLALIEQGAKVYAAIHARLHRSMARTLEALHQLNCMYLDEETVVREAGELLAKREDFEGPMDVVPVSDPNIFSETQRFAQTQAVAQRAVGNPLYDARKVEELILKRLKIPDALDLLIPKPEPQRLNPVNENVAACQGTPVIAFPDQDHVAHLRTHIEFLMNPMFGMNPLLQPVLLPILLPHIKDHMVYAYVSAVVEAADKAAQMSVSELMDDDEEVSMLMDRMLADASTAFLDDSEELFDMVMPPPALPQRPGEEPKKPSALLAMLSQMNQILQSFQPPMPMDPSAVQSQEVERKSAADQQKATVDQGKVQNDAKKIALAERDQQLEQEQQNIDRMTEERLQTRAIQADVQIATQNNTVKEEINTADNLTALTIADAEIQSGENVALSTGGGIDPGNGAA